MISDRSHTDRVEMPYYMNLALDNGVKQARSRDHHAPGVLLGWENAMSAVPLADEFSRGAGSRSMI